MTPTPDPVPYEYAVLRVVPRVDRGEFVNAAVVLYCQQFDYLSCADGLDTDRLVALHPGTDLDAVTAALSSVCAVCDGGPQAGLAGAESLRARFGWLTAPRSTVLQPGPVHAGLTTDPAADLRRLAARLVQL
jgi:Protein of unknown function (DUF3037)